MAGPRASAHFGWLLIGYIVLLGSGLGWVGIIDYDEGAYAEVARAMVLREDYLNPSLNGVPFYEKPPLLYWMQAAGFHLFGVDAFGARLGNFLASAMLLVALFAFSRRALGGSAALLAAVIAATALEYVVLSQVALTDIVLSLTFMVSVGCVHRALQAARAGATGNGWFLVAAASAGVGMLAKGAVGLALPLGAYVLHVAFEREWRLLARPVWWLGGAIVALGIGLSWYLAIGFTQPGGFTFMGELWWEHHVDRFLNPMQGHSGSPLYYLPVLVLGFFPWSPFLPLLWTRRATWMGKDEAGRWVRLCATFAALTFVFFSVAATKLPNYLLPVLPFSAVALSWPLLQVGPLGSARGERRGIVVLATILMVLGVVFGCAPLLIKLLPDILGEDIAKVPGLATPPAILVPALGAAAIASIAGVVGLWLVRSERGDRALKVSVAGFVLFVLFGFRVLLPIYDSHFQQPLRDVAVQGAEYLEEEQRVVVLGLKRRPSVTFYSGAPIEYCKYKNERDREKASVVLDEPGRIIITSRYVLDRIQDWACLEILGTSGGFALAKTRGGILNPPAEPVDGDAGPER